ncbi:MAG: hypothetical protein M3N54_06680, partial [Acidobacteriota bacterium]|nr:hypothetical protein [Acidobacteriota bacterium]
TGDGTDDRFFCLAESRIAKSTPVIRLTEGWHEQENGAWRWTKPEFAAVIENATGATVFELRFSVESARAITVQAEVNGAMLPERRYQAAGDHVYREAIDPAARLSRIRVRLTGSFESQGRVLGVIVRLPGSTIVDDECGLRLLPSTEGPPQMR